MSETWNWGSPWGEKPVKISQPSNLKNIVFVTEKSSLLGISQVSFVLTLYLECLVKQSDVKKIETWILKIIHCTSYINHLIINKL